MKKLLLLFIITAFISCESNIVEVPVKESEIVRITKEVNITLLPTIMLKL